MATGRKEIGRKTCKAGRACGPGTESWERNSAAGCSVLLRPREGHAVGKPLLYFALQRPRQEQLQLEMCAEKSGREGV